MPKSAVHDLRKSIETQKQFFPMMFSAVDVSPAKMFCCCERDISHGVCRRRREPRSHVVSTTVDLRSAMSFAAVDASLATMTTGVIATLTTSSASVNAIPDTNSTDKEVRLALMLTYRQSG